MGVCLSLKLQQTPTVSITPSTVVCVICLSEANIVLYPCGHFCLCQSCSDKLLRQTWKNKPEMKYLELDYKIKRRGMKCPMCRRKGLPAIVYPNIVY